VSGHFHAPAALPPGKSPGTHCIGAWVDPRAGLDKMEKWKFLTLPGLEPRPLSRPARSHGYLMILRINSPTSFNVLTCWPLYQTYSAFCRLGLNFKKYFDEFQASKTHLNMSVHTGGITNIIFPQSNLNVLYGWNELSTTCLYPSFPFILNL
jgi:hypothetical protein